MVNNSTNINKTNSHVSSLITEHKKDHIIWRWKTTHICGGAKPENEMPASSC
jgi:hypothetical protein